ncbi:hypothetical protein Y032_0408g925 [Ancylostoma ceylanicum]|uniref:Cation-transporting ATPase n=1 Tax=Ancylostoma ceylanicum TaxID=53326 RepID=A0A016X216_9BILA|nr:hypothetical protein Y032_0408g925 [Ancylostoma ceylanicum]
MRSSHGERLRCDRKICSNKPDSVVLYVLSGKCLRNYCFYRGRMKSFIYEENIERRPLLLDANSDSYQSLADGEMGQERHVLKIRTGDEVLELYAYKLDRAKTVLYYALTICTLGLFRLLLHWKPDWYIKVRATRCAHEVAHYVNVIDEHNVEAFRPIRLYTSASNGIVPQIPTVRTFLR